MRPVRLQLWWLQPLRRNRSNGDGNDNDDGNNDDGDGDGDGEGMDVTSADAFDGRVRVCGLEGGVGQRQSGRVIK
jgi:hypothetical protein